MLPSTTNAEHSTCRGMLLGHLSIFTYHISWASVESKYGVQPLVLLIIIASHLTSNIISDHPGISAESKSDAHAAGIFHTRLQSIAGKAATLKDNQGTRPQRIAVIKRANTKVERNCMSMEREIIQVHQGLLCHLATIQGPLQVYKLWKNIWVISSAPQLWEHNLHSCLAHDWNCMSEGHTLNART